MANWQSLLAVDAKFNTYRAPSSPCFKGLYLRRRSQLLRSSKRFENNSKKMQAYLQIRLSLLQQRYAVSLDQISQRSWNPSHRSISRNTTIDVDSLCSTPTASFRGLTIGSSSSKTNKSSSLPARAESQSCIDNTTISENYEFSGVYHIFDQHKDSVTMVKFGYNDASLLCCSSFDGNLSVCQLDNSNPRVVHKLQKHTSAVTGFDWSCSNDLIVSGGMDGQICLWSASDGNCLRAVLDQANSQVLSCIFHPLNSNWVVAGNSVGLLQVLNISTGRYPTGGTSQVAGAVTALTFDNSGNILWAANAKGSINSFKFEISSGRLKKRKRIVVNEGGAITCLTAKTWTNKQGRDSALLVNCKCNSLYLYRIMDDDGGLKLRKVIAIPHMSQSIHSTFSPIMSFRKGSCVVTGSEDCEVWVLDVERESNPVINKLQGHSAPVLSVSFNYTETHLASSDASGLVIIWK